MSREYDLKASEDSVGQLYPVLLSKDAKVIDGYHRLKADEDWRTETLEHIDTEEKLLVARCISNWHRRSVPWSEKAEWINGLARIYQKQGLKIGDRRKGEANEIVNKLIDIIGLGRDTVIEYLDDVFKQEKIGGVPKGRVFVPASQRIETNLGPEVVERHREEVRREIAEEVKEEVKAEVKEEVKTEVREEVKAEVKAEVKEEVAEEVREEVKEELRRDPEFVEEVAEEYRKKKVDELLTEVLGEEKEDVEAKRKTERYHEMVVSTFYRVMGWGVPMVLAMGKEQWDKTLPYIAGIQNRMDFLLAIKPDKPLDEQPEEPKIEVKMDRRKVVEAEYQIVED